MKKRKIRLALDIALTLLLGCQMGYSLMGEAAHEITGLCMLALLAAHHIVNGGFHRGLFRGRYTPYRAALTAVDALMLVIFIMQGASGLTMAKHVRLLNGGGIGWARQAHLLGAYWGFVLCGIHAGLHMRALPRKWAGIDSKAAKAGSALAVLIAAGYGVMAFVRRGLFGYMTLKQQFVFFDFSEPLARFYLDYAAIWMACMAVGCAAGYALTGRRRK